MIDRTVNLGHILTISAMIVAVFGAYYNVKGDIREHSIRITNAETNISQSLVISQKLLTEIAAIRQDIAVIRERIDRPFNEIPHRGNGR